jgi:osmoprotectant transport system ATP-binding protein
VGLARALASNPPILLMDEPFGALDPVTRNSIRQEFLGLDELKRKTIIMVTHDVEEAFLLGDKICLMDAGKIQQMGTPAELLFNPANDFSRNFFGSDRLLLEMKATKISDIWNSLVNAKDEHNGNAQYVAYEDNLWVVMERLTERSYQTINVRKHNDIKVVTLPGILNALSQLKTTT